MKAFIKTLLIFITGILAILLVLIALSYFSFDMNYHFLKAKQRFLENPVWISAFYIHLLFGVIAILSGFPLFFNKWISFKGKTHKNFGITYVTAILIFTGPTGLYLAFYAEGGVWASIGFTLMSFAWMIPTYIGYNKIVTKNYREHYKWMIRSYAITLAGVSLRLITPLCSKVFKMGYDETFIFTSFASWIINLIIAEIIIRSNTNHIEKNLKLVIS